uniref:Ig-like domain-containing protein n=1 Tax=Sparus aurata TaxID=8175 RepID=A0A671XY81_SPAAU
VDSSIHFLINAQTAALKLSSSVHLDGGLLSLKTGDNLTLTCFYKADVPARLYWYKQPLGQKLQLIATFYYFDQNGTFYNEFKNNPRFTLDTGDGKNHLKISDLRISDSAAYCCFCYIDTIETSESITVSVTGSARVHQSASEIIQPGGSVTLNCTVHTGTCDGEHSVYWFKHSQESHPGLIYTHGGRNDQCERKDNTQTHTCVYNLPMKSLNLSHTGTYYCAVASCGHILFGNGTKLDFEGKKPSRKIFLITIKTTKCYLDIFHNLIDTLIHFYTFCHQCHGDADNLHYAAVSNWSRFISALSVKMDLVSSLWSAVKRCSTVFLGMIYHRKEQFKVLSMDVMLSGFMECED